MLVFNLPFKALMFLTLMRPSLVLFLVLWLKLVKDFLKVRCRLALLPFLISCLIWLDLVASLPLIKERILVIILLLHFLSLMLGSVLVLMLPLLVWLTPFIQEPPSGDLQERVLIRHHDYDQCFQSVQLLQWNSQVKFNVTVYRNLPTTRDSIMTS